MIKAYAGYFGTGKTLSMVAEGIGYMRKGYKVFSNTPIACDLYRPYSIRDIWRTCSLGTVQRIHAISLDPDQFNYALANERDCIFLLDEASIWFSNYNWNKVDSKILYRLHQVRKLNIHVIYTCQSFKHVMPRLRDFTQIVIDCKPYFRRRDGSPRLVRHLWYNPEFYSINSFSIEFEQRYIMARSWLWGKPLNDALKSYDTFEVIKYSMGAGKSQFEKKPEDYMGDI